MIKLTKKDLLKRKNKLIKKLAKTKIDKIYLEAINLFFGWRIALVLVGLIAVRSLPNNTLPQVSLKTIWKIWSRWDVSWFYGISIHGYQQIKETAFFPAWPLLIHMSKLIFTTTNVYILSFILANILFLISLILFARLLKFDYKKSTIIWALVFMCIFPMSFYFSIGYSESLFLTLVLATFVSARKNYWWLVGIFGFFASATRAIGFLLFIPMLIGYFEYQGINYKSLRKIRWNIIFLILIPLGLVAYQYYLSKTFNNPLAFINAEAHWGRSINNTKIWAQMLPGLQIVFTLKKVFSSEWTKQLVINLFYLLPILSTAYLVYRKKYSYASYLILGSLLPLSTGLGSFARFLAPLFPIYVALADGTEKVPNLRYYLAPIFVGLLVMYLIMFSNGFWVA